MAPETGVSENIVILSAIEAAFNRILLAPVFSGNLSSLTYKMKCRLGMEYSLKLDH